MNADKVTADKVTLRSTLYIMVDVVALITILISETEVHNNQDLAFLGSDIPIV
jgi:hypothetical protein